MLSRSGLVKNYACRVKNNFNNFSVLVYLRLYYLLIYSLSHFLLNVYHLQGITDRIFTDKRLKFVIFEISNTRDESPQVILKLC